MSGTSLDGVDLAMIHFKYNGEWDFSILNAATIPYPEEWLERLKNYVDLSKKRFGHIRSRVHPLSRYNY